MFPQKVRSVHFGDAEDILSTSFLREEDAQDPPSEEKRRTEEICHRLQLALKTDDVSMLKHLMVEVPDLAEKYMDKPVLHLAAEYGALKISQEFVSKPSDSINSATSDYEASTPLYWAIRNGHRDVANWLLSNGAFHQPLNVFQDTAVYVAVQYEQYDILNVLKDYNCDFDMANSNNDLPIKYVIRKGDVTGLDKLLQCGADVYAKKNENSPLSDSEDLSETFEDGSVEHKPCSSPKKLKLIKLEDVLKSLFPCDQDLDDFFTICITDRNFLVIECLRKYDPGHTILLRAMETSKDNHDLSVLSYFAENRYFDTYSNQNPLMHIVRCCITYSGFGHHKYPGRSLEDYIEGLRLAKSTGYAGIHKFYRKALKIFVQNGLSPTSTALTKPSPFMYAAAHSIICLLFEFLRLGSGIYIHRKNDLDLLQNVVNTAISHIFRPSGLRRKSIRTSFILLTYCIQIPKSIVQLCLAQSLMDFESQPYVFRTSVRQLVELVLYRSNNVCTLQHLCRLAIIVRFKSLSWKHETSSLPLPKRLKDYLYLEDILQQDKDMWLQCGSFDWNYASQISDNQDFERCDCFPFKS